MLRLQKHGRGTPFKGPVATVSCCKNTEGSKAAGGERAGLLCSVGQESP